MCLKYIVDTHEKKHTLEKVNCTHNTIIISLSARKIAMSIRLSAVKENKEK